MNDRFKKEFWITVRGDLAATDVIHKLQAQNRPMDRVINLLAVLSDPETDIRIKRQSPKLTRLVIPSQKRLFGLSERMKTLGADLNEVFLMPGLIHPEAPRVLQFARTSIGLASEVGSIKMSPLTKIFGYKSFWKHMPIAMLFLELQVPESLSFREVGYLVRCADRVRGRKRARPYRSLQRQYERFTKQRVRWSEFIKALSAVFPEH